MGEEAIPESFLDCLRQVNSGELLSLAQSRSWRRGSPIASHHKPVRQVVVLVSGFAGKIVYGAHGREGALPMVAGDVHGLDWLAPVQLSCDLKAYVPCETLHFNPDLLMSHIVRLDPPQMQRLACAYIMQANRLAHHAAGLLAGSVERRVEHVMRLAGHGGRATGFRAHDLRHVDLAELVGASRPHLSTTLGRMGRQGDPEARAERENGP